MIHLKNMIFIKLLCFILFINFPSAVFSSQSKAIEKYKPSAPTPKTQITVPSANINIESNFFLSPMPFRLGFEFQEISSLCPWAKNMEDVIKKPVFSIHLKNETKPLWHVEIDDVDIEFVTPPFDPTEKETLKIAIKTIIMAIDNLKNAFKNQSKIPFKQWIMLLSQTFGSDHFTIAVTEVFDKIKEHNIIRPEKQIKSSPVFFPKEEKKTIRAIEWKNKEKEEQKEAPPIEDEYTWQPMFAPQVTIQHPLEDTIPLYFSLFGFHSRNIIRFLSSLPFLDLYKQSLETTSSNTTNKFISIFTQKVHGLIFLHALTMSDMTPMINPNTTKQGIDQELLQETLETWTKYRQIDPKLKLALMSRRPFSQMYADLEQTGYAEHFSTAMELNSHFMKYDAIPKNFSKTNYAEQFLDNNKRPLNLLPFAKLFKLEFSQNNTTTLQELLSQGILSTTMLHNIKDQIQFENHTPINSIFNDFFSDTLKSIEHPTIRYDFSPDKGFLMRKTNYDTLSPPWLLHLTNAMGHYKKLSLNDLKYGEALIEVRSISDVQPWFLLKMGLPAELTGDFLRYPSNDTVNQALGLFNFLATFHSEENILEIFYLGLPYATLKN